MTEHAPESVHSPHKKGYRRKRTAFTDTQLEKMESLFQANKYPGIALREKLATSLGVSESRVQVWFQNRRSKFRKRENNTRHPVGGTPRSINTNMSYFSWPHTRESFGGNSGQGAKEQPNGSASRSNVAHIPPFHSQIPAITSDNAVAPTICTSLHGTQHRIASSGFPMVFYSYSGLPVVKSIFTAQEANHIEHGSPATLPNKPQTPDLQKQEELQFGRSNDEILAAKGLVKVRET